MKSKEGDALGMVWGHGAEGDYGWRTEVGVSKMILMVKKS